MRLQPCRLGGFWGQATGDGSGDQGAALFLESGNELALLGHQLVDLDRLGVEKTGDDLLLL